MHDDGAVLGQGIGQLAASKDDGPLQSFQAHQRKGCKEHQLLWAARFLRSCCLPSGAPTQPLSAASTTPMKQSRIVWQVLQVAQSCSLPANNGEYVMNSLSRKVVEEEGPDLC